MAQPLNSALEKMELYTLNAYHGVHVRKKGYQKALYIYNIRGFLKTDDISYGTLPEKYCPSEDINVWVNLNGLAKANLIIKSTGEVNMKSATEDTPTNSHISVMLQYL